MHIKWNKFLNYISKSPLKIKVEKLYNIYTNSLVSLNIDLSFLIKINEALFLYYLNNIIYIFFSNNNNIKIIFLYHL